MVCAIALVACNGQNEQSPPGGAAQDDAMIARTDTPRVEVKVNKQYDEHGNLIAYDSSYVSILSHGLGDTAFIDNLFRDFRTPFTQRHPFLNDTGFDRLFFNDSLLFHDFFRDDFLRKRMERNRHYKDRMMRDMDSLKNQWFQQQATPLPPSRTI